MKTVEQIAATLCVNELMPRLKRAGLTIEQSPVSHDQMALAATFKHAGLITTADIRKKLDEAFAK